MTDEGNLLTGFRVWGSDGFRQVFYLLPAFTPSLHILEGSSIHEKANLSQD